MAQREWQRVRGSEENTSYMLCTHFDLWRKQPIQMDGTFLCTCVFATFHFRIGLVVSLWGHLTLLRTDDSRLESFTAFFL